MAQSIRQSELFAGEDWKTIYRAFTEINFNAADFDTIRTAMVDYIRQNYPEDFNDWIESSEFVFILDIIAYLGEQLMFRFDLNVRENFIDTAERKDSILRLARMLSYSPRRNSPATGLLKIESIQTTESLSDSNDRDLTNLNINWNDPSNPDWFEQWTIIMNSALSTINPFGRPMKTGKLLGNTTQLYPLNNAAFDTPVMNFSANVDNTGMSFEIINPDFTDNVWFEERTPVSGNNAFNLIYMNDGLGNNSSRTGFFFYFKEGQLQSEPYYFRDALENRLVELNITGVNENDVWLQEVDENGNVLSNWEKVPTVLGENIIYNSTDANIRDIYTVLTRDDEQISIRFADGRFGRVPQGFFKLWYRTSNGLSYRIRPQDIQKKQVSIQYFNSLNELHTLTFTFSLNDYVTNSRPGETLEQVRQRAPRVYYTQNRMVTGEDYNFFPQRSNLARKIKAVNRVYSGHSRYIDINDPTGLYQNTNVFSNDGILYKSEENNYTSIPRVLNKSASQIVLEYIQPMIKDVEMKNYLNERFYEQFKLTENGGANIPGTNSPIHWQNITWRPSTSAIYNHTGIFSNSVAQGNGGDSTDYITEGAMLKFHNAGWVKVEAVEDFGNEFPDNDETRKGEVTLSAYVEDGDYIVEIKPAIRTTLTQDEVDAMENEIDNNNSFAIRYDIAQRTWSVIGGNHINLSDSFDFSTAGEEDDPNADTTWLIYVEFNPDMWRLTTRGLMYMFESERDVRFFYVDTYKVNDIETGRSRRDYVKIVDTNAKPHSTPEEWSADGTVAFKGDFVTYRGNMYRCTSDHTKVTGLEPDTGSNWIEMEVSGLGQEHLFKLDRPFIYDDGHIEPRRVRVDFFDAQDDGLADNPESFEQIVLNDWVSGGDAITERNRYVFWEKYTDDTGYQYKRPRNDIYVYPNLVGGVLQHLPTSSANTVTHTTDTVPSVIGGEATGDVVVSLNNATLSSEHYKIYVFNGTAYAPLVMNNEDLVMIEGVLYHYDATNAQFEKPEYVQSDVFFDWQNKEFWKYDYSNNPSNPWNKLTNYEFEYKTGRSGIDFQWKHYAPRNHRVDPARSNIMDIYVLTTEYDTAIRQWIATGTENSVEPLAPSNNDLHIAFSDFDEFKMVSDHIIWKPVKYKKLFGKSAVEELRAKFKVVKIDGTTVSDGEIRSRVISAINEYFAVDNWDFGETFYYTELAAYIHQQMATVLAAVVIVPQNEEAKFGNLFQVKAEADEIFISTADVGDVIIENSLTETNLRIGN